MSTCARSVMAGNLRAVSCPRRSCGSGRAPLANAAHAIARLALRLHRHEAQPAVAGADDAVGADGAGRAVARRRLAASAP